MGRHSEENIGNGRNYYSPKNLGVDIPPKLFQGCDFLENNGLVR